MAFTGLIARTTLRRHSPLVRPATRGRRRWTKTTASLYRPSWLGGSRAIATANYTIHRQTAYSRNRTVKIWMELAKLGHLYLVSTYVLTSRLCALTFRAGTGDLE